MKVNRNSWHYKMVDYICDYPEDNLCAYFRQIVFCMLIMVIGCAVATCILSPITIFFIDYSVYPFIVFCGLIIWGIFLVIAATLCGKLFRKRINLPDFSENIIYQRIVSIKDRVCPIIEFYDDE